MSLPETPSIALGLVLANAARFRPFERQEFTTFQGIETNAPRICFLGDGETAIVLDGSRVAFYDGAGNWMQFDLTLVASEEVAS